jgi:DNA polymerase III subunit delta
VADFKQIIDTIRNKNFAPIYILDGEEPYYLDKLMDLFEETVLSPEERDFNLSVLYGRDVKAMDIISSCRRFPMFADRQVILVKDASAMTDFDKLEPYFLQPTPSTLLVIEYRNKKIDTRTKLGKMIKEKHVHFCSDKIKEEAIPNWIIQFGKELGFDIAHKEAEILTLYLGNNLQKIASEIEKIRINAPDEKILSGSLIQKYIGINRDYNLFEFPEAFSSGDKDKTYRMLSYFLENTKSSPMVLVTVSFYTHFIQLYKANFAAKLPEKEWASALGVNPYYVKNIVSKTRRWPLHKVEESLLLIAEYNAKCVGINSSESDTELLKEMMGKLELVESMT